MLSGPLAVGIAGHPLADQVDGLAAEANRLLGDMGGGQRTGGERLVARHESRTDDEVWPRDADTDGAASGDADARPDAREHPGEPGHGRASFQADVRCLGG
jgi:hypothetical protein